MNPSKATFSEADLAELDGVFEDVCAAVNATGELDEGTRGAIRRRLFVLACNGMTNPKAMRHHLILNFSRSKTRSSARERLANAEAGRPPLNVASPGFQLPLNSRPSIRVQRS